MYLNLHGFTTIWNYITLKPQVLHSLTFLRFTTIWNYITLKPGVVYVFKSSWFYHYLELHHSQTAKSNYSAIAQFYHYLELHHSQTSIVQWFRFFKFYHYLELHHSQTIQTRRGR